MILLVYADIDASIDCGACRLMPLAEAVAGFRASFVLLICAAAGTYAVQGELAELTCVHNDICSCHIGLAMLAKCL